MGALLFGGGIVILALLYLTTSAVTVLATNEDCDPIRVTGSIPVRLPGLSLPDTIPTGTTQTFRVPRVVATIDASNDDPIRISLLGMQFPATMRPGLSVTADGMQIIGNFTTIRLGEQPVHKIVIACR